MVVLLCPQCRGEHLDMTKDNFVICAECNNIFLLQLPATNKIILTGALAEVIFTPNNRYEGLIAQLMKGVTPKLDKSGEGLI